MGSSEMDGGGLDGGGIEQACGKKRWDRTEGLKGYNIFASRNSGTLASGSPLFALGVSLRVNKPRPAAPTPTFLHTTSGHAQRS